jgi:3-phosphoshikimate 1-carboxyvinyltransferase
LTLSARPLTVRPGSGLAGSFDPPGDKSITHRAYLFGLMADGETRVVRPNRGADCESSLACARRLGAVVTFDAGGTRIAGRDLDLAESDGVLDCGNSGTTLRLLAGILAGQRGLAILDGDASLRQRPVARIVEPLRRMGAFLAARDGDRLPPLVIRGGPLRGMDHEPPIPSAQVLGCLILAGLQAAGSTTVALPGAARDHTERMLPTFGIEPEIQSLPSGGRRVTVHGPARMRGAAL